MPKGHRDEYTATCRACGGGFRTTKVGKAAFFCHTPECDRQRELDLEIERDHSAALRMDARLERAAERRVSGVLRRAEIDAYREDAKRERKIERAAEREQAKHDRRMDREREKERRRREREAERAEKKRQAAIAKAVRGRRLTVFNPIMDDPEQLLYVDEIVGVAARLPEFAQREDGRREIRKAILAVARAEGAAQIHRAWQRVAAVALIEADRTRPRMDRDTAPTEIDEALAAV